MLSFVQETVIELTKARGDLDVKRMHAENELRQCQHARQSLEVEKDLLQKDVAALQTQLADKSESLRQSWADANAKVGHIRRFPESDDIGPIASSCAPNNLPCACKTLPRMQMHLMASEASWFATTNCLVCFARLMSWSSNCKGHKASNRPCLHPISNLSNLELASVSNSKQQKRRGRMHSLNYKSRRLLLRKS